MTDNELINGIIDGTLGKNDVLKHCAETPDLKYLAQELKTAFLSLQVCKEKLKLTYCGSSFSLEEQRLYSAIKWVEEVIEQAAAQEPEQAAAQEPEQEHAGTSILDTLPYPDRAKKYFAKAIERGWMDKDGEEHFKWLLNKASLAYFCVCVFCPNLDRLPEAKLGELFKKSRLSSAADKASLSEQKWKPMINELFKD